MHLEVIERILNQPGVSDLVYNGFDRSFAQVSGRWSQVESPFASETELKEFVVNLAHEQRRRLDFAQPFADLSLGQLRFHLALPASGSQKTLVSIRRHGVGNFRLEQVLEKPELWLGTLVRIVESKSNFIICGGTGSGKTTLLRAMFNLAKSDRVITIEDVSELELELPNRVSMVARQANSDGAGQIDLQRLVIESLRMKPDRLVIGEVRGPELQPMLQALNSGHKGSATTIHANHAEDLPARLIGIGLAAGLSPETTAHLASSAFDFVISLGPRQRQIVVESISPLVQNQKSTLVVGNEF